MTSPAGPHNPTPPAGPGRPGRPASVDIDRLARILADAAPPITPEQAATIRRCMPPVRAAQLAA